MLSPTTPIITPPRVPLVDPRTGLISRAWYLFFLSLNNATTAIIDDSGVTFSAESTIASVDAALQAVNQELQTLPPVLDLSDELVKLIDAATLADCCSALVSQVAELQKQIDAVNLLPPPMQGTVTAVTATSPVVSSGGTTPDISMPAANTSTNGYLTSTDWNTFNGKAPATSGTSILYGNGSGGFSNVTIGSGVSFVGGTLAATGSGGSVTSVGLALPTEFTVTNSPVTTSGTLTGAWASQTAKYFFAAPNASAGTPSFRAIVASDIPALSYVSSVGATAPITSSGGLTPTIGVTAAALTEVDDTNVTLTLGGSPTTALLAATSITVGWTGQLAVGRGGTGVATATANTVFAGPTSGGAAAPSFRSLVAADIPTLSYVTSVSGTSPVVSSGGTTPAISLASGYGDTQNPYASKTANTFLAAPNGSAGAPTFRAIVAADVPALPYNPTAAPVTQTANFSVGATDVWTINNKSGSSCVVTLPTASSNSGRVLYFQNYQAQTLVSASSNVVPLVGGSATTAILEAVAGANATLVSDGTSWIMTQYSSNNSLQLE